MIYKQLRLSAPRTRPFIQVRTAWGLTRVECFVEPTATRCSTAALITSTDALASTGALYRKDHLGIFRCGNLRTLGCDWLLWPHDNLGRKCSCVLSPSVSLEGSWGVFGGLGRPLSFNITGKQKKWRKCLHPCMAFHLLDGPSFVAIWICEDSWWRNKLTNQVGSYQTRTAFGIIWSFSSSWTFCLFLLHVFLLFIVISAPALLYLPFIRGAASWCFAEKMFYFKVMAIMLKKASSYTILYLTCSLRRHCLAIC